jgi:long-chain fatty acid transport protein
VNLSPNVAVKITDWLQVGAGFDVMYSELTFKQFYPWAVFPGAPALWPEGNAEASGDGFGFGGNLGITVKPFKGHRLAVTYRSPMTVNYGGDFTINNVPDSARAIGITPESDFGSQITFPTIVAIGYGIEVTDTIRVEADLEWIQFSKFQSLDLNLGNDALLLPRSSIAQNWKNTYTAGIAADWRFHPNWIVRGGYQHYQTPVPDYTMSTTIPDANQNVITVGLAFEKGHNRVELAYGYDFYDTRNITKNQNPAFNGQYNIWVHMISFAYSYRF